MRTNLIDTIIHNRPGTWPYTTKGTEMEYTVKFQNGFTAQIRARNDAGAKRTASKMKTYEAGNMALYNEAGAIIGRRELVTWPGGGWSWTGWI